MPFHLPIREAFKKGIIDERKPIGLLIHELNTSSDLAEFHLTHLESDNPDIRQTALTNLLEHAKQIDIEKDFVLKMPFSESMTVNIFKQFLRARAENVKNPTNAEIAKHLRISEKKVLYIVELLAASSNPVIKEVMARKIKIPPEITKLRAQIFDLCILAKSKDQKLTRKKIATMIRADAKVSLNCHHLIYDEIEFMVNKIGWMSNVIVGLKPLPLGRPPKKKTRSYQKKSKSRQKKTELPQIHESIFDMLNNHPTMDFSDVASQVANAFDMQYIDIYKIMMDLRRNGKLKDYFLERFK